MTMTKNKKKLRRAEKRYSVTKSAQTLVLAGILLAGGVGNALATTWGPSDNVSITADETLAESKSAKNLTIDKGILTVPGTNRLYVTGATLLSGGELQLLGSHGLVGAPTDDLNGTVTGSFTMTGGELYVGDHTNNGSGSQLQMHNVDIAGGITYVGGKISNGVNWDDGSMIVGGLTAGEGAAMKITGGTIELGYYGQLVSAKGVDFEISGGTIDILAGSAGAASIIRASSKADDAKGTAGYSTLKISGGNINVGLGDDGKALHAVILSRETVMSGGTIDVQGELIMAGTAVTGKSSIAAGIADAGANQWGSFKLAWGENGLPGGTVTVGTTGKLDARTIDFVQTGGNFTTNGLLLAPADNVALQSGDTAFKSLDLSSGTFTVENLTIGADKIQAATANAGDIKLTNGFLHIKDTLTLTNTADVKTTYTGSLGTRKLVLSDATKAYEQNTGSLTLHGTKEGGAFLVAKDFTISGGFVSLGVKDRTEGVNSFGGQTTVSGGTLNVGHGNWELAKLDVSSGHVNITDGNLNIGSELKSAAAGNSTQGSEAGVYISGNGVLSGSSTVFVKEDSAGTYDRQKDLNTIEVGNSGTLEILWNNNVTLTTAQLKEIRQDLITGDGLLSHKGAKFDLDTIENDPALNGSVSVTDAASTGTLLNGYTVGADGNSGTANVTTGGFGADALVIKDNTTGGTPATTATVSLDKNLTLTGASGSLVTVKDANGKTTGAKVTVEAKDQTLNIGSAAADAGSGTLAKVSVGESTKAGGLNVVNGSYTITDIVTSGSGINTLTVEAATLASTKVDLTTGTGEDTLNIANGGTLNAGTIITSTGDTIAVGNEKGGGTLTADKVNLAGGSLLVDPEWDKEASRVAIAQFTDKSTAADVNAVGGLIGVGRNSMLTIGTTDTAWLSGVVAQAGGLSENGYSAAMGLYKGVTLTALGGIELDGAKTTDGASKLAPQANTATFADGSLLAVYAPNMEGKVALTGTGTSVLNVKEGASLMIVDGKIEQTVTVVDGFVKPTGDNIAGWTDDNLLTNTKMLKAEGEWDSTKGKYNVTISRGASAREVFPLLDGELAGIVDKMYESNAHGLDSSNAGIKFLSRATDGRGIYTANATEAAATIEGAARLAVAGATQGVTMSAVTAGTSAATSRTSMASPLQSQKAQVVALNGESVQSGLNAGDVKNGVGLWIMPLYQSNNTWGMKAGDFKTGYTSDLGGVAIGADYTFNEAVRVGVAFNIGGGYAQSQGDFNKTDNNFNFWGVNLYGGWAQNNFGITADVGYTSSYNKLEQELQSSMDMGNIKADVTSSAITAGLRGEYKFETEALDIIPHVGVRYMSLMTDSYDAKSHGTVFNADETYQSIWTFPIGVTLTKEIVNASGWAFKPQLDLQIIPAAGDVKAKSKVRVPGIDASADLSTRVMDDITYGGGVGFDIRKDNVSFGVNYNLQASEHSTAHGVFATVRYEF